MKNKLKYLTICIVCLENKNKSRKKIVYEIPYNVYTHIFSHFSICSISICNKNTSNHWIFIRGYLSFKQCIIQYNKSYYNFFISHTDVFNDFLFNSFLYIFILFIISSSSLSSYNHHHYNDYNHQRHTFTMT